MKSNITRWAIVLIFITLLGAACSKAKDDQPEPANMHNDVNETVNNLSDAIDDASVELQARIEQFRTEMNANLAEFDANIAQLQADRDAMTDEQAKQTFDARLARLKADRDALQAEIDQMQNQQNQNNWQQFEDDVKAKWHDLENGVKDAIDSMRGQS
jgi:uncharacterized protein (DUF3084 family)